MLHKYLNSPVLVKCYSIVIYQIDPTKDKHLTGNVSGCGIQKSVTEFYIVFISNNRQNTETGFSIVYLCPHNMIVKAKIIHI